MSVRQRGMLSGILGVLDAWGWRAGAVLQQCRPPRGYVLRRGVPKLVPGFLTLTMSDLLSDKK